MKKLLTFCTFALLLGSSVLNYNAVAKPSEIAKNFAPLKKQMVNFELGVRYIKLANSWRENGDNKLCYEYLMKSYMILSNYATNYWTGYLYESLGYFYKDAGENEKALMYFIKANRVYQVYGGTDDGNGSDAAMAEQVLNLKESKSSPLDEKGEGNEILPEKVSKSDGDHASVKKMLLNKLDELIKVANKLD